MEFLYIIIESSSLMYLLAFICAVFCIRCLIHGTMAGTSAILRVLLTLLFACMAYYCWQRAGSIHSANIIDRFVHDTWIECKQLFYFVKSKF